MPENKQQEAARITGRYGIAIALIGGVCLLLSVILVSWLSTDDRQDEGVKHKPPAPKQGQSLAFTKIEPMPQMVNKKFEPIMDDVRGKEISGTELATFRFAISDEGTTSVHVTRGELIVDKVERIHYGMATAMAISEMDHEGHVQVFLQNPEVGDSIPVSLNTTVLRDSKREFVIWFRSTEHLLKARNILRVSGRLKLHYESGSITSKPIEIEIHGDTIEMETKVPP